jgi:hypothetical protein
MDFLGPGGGNKTVCRVMGPEMKKKILKTPFLILLPTLAFMSVCVFDHLFDPLSIMLFKI